MGQRANLIVVEDEGYRLFYSHWRANTLPRDLFWGPEHARRFITMQREAGPGGWLDEVWAEGGAVLDPGRRILLAFGGEDILLDVPLRRLWLAMMQQTWPGWEIRWACEGIADLADSVRHPRSAVLRDEPDEVDREPLAPPEEVDWTSSVAGIAHATGELEFFPLASVSCEHVLFNGPAILDVARRVGGREQLSMAGNGAGFPTSGFHVDEESRTVDLWTASGSPEVEARVAQHWPGFVVRWHRDRFEAQLERSDGRLTFPDRPRAELLDRLRSILLAEERPGHPLDGILDHLAAEGQAVQVNEYALRDDRLDLPVGERTARFERAARAVLEQSG